MKNKKPQDKCLFLEDGILQSLLYLYQELLKSNMQVLAFIMEATIRDCEEAIRKNFVISSTAEDIFTQFHLIRRMRPMSKEQRAFFLEKIDKYQDNH